MSQLLKRLGTLQTVTVEALSGIDGQGKPSYGTGEEIHARVIREDDVVRGTDLAGGDGEEVRTMMTVWIDACESPLPEHGSRLTTDDGQVGIVVNVKNVRNIRRGTLDHVRVKLREE